MGVIGLEVWKRGHSYLICFCGRPTNRHSVSNHKKKVTKDVSSYEIKLKSKNPH